MPRNTKARRLTRKIEKATVKNKPLKKSTAKKVRRMKKDSDIFAPSVTSRVLKKPLDKLISFSQGVQARKKSRKMK